MHLSPVEAGENTRNHGTAHRHRPGRSPLKDEFEWYLAHQDEMVAKHNGKFVVIKDAEVLGVYDDQYTAVVETQKKHALGTFLVQKVEPGKAGYTQAFHSRVAFS